MSFKLDWGNSLKDFEDSVDSSIKISEQEIQNIIKKTVSEVLRDVKRRTPTKSGRLRRSWRAKRQTSKKSYSYLIENNVKYASFVENGTRHTVPVKMLRIAMERAEKRLKKRLAALGRKLEKDFNNGN